MEKPTAEDLKVCLVLTPEQLLRVERLVKETGLAKSEAARLVLSGFKVEAEQPKK